MDSPPEDTNTTRERISADTERFIHLARWLSGSIASQDWVLRYAMARLTDGPPVPLLPPSISVTDVQPELPSEDSDTAQDDQALRNVLDTTKIKDDLQTLWNRHIVSQYDHHPQMDVTITRPDHETVYVNRTTLAARIDCAKALIRSNITDRASLEDLLISNGSTDLFNDYFFTLDSITKRRLYPAPLQHSRPEFAFWSMNCHKTAEYLPDRTTFASDPESEQPLLPHREGADEGVMQEFNVDKLDETSPWELAVWDPVNPVDPQEGQGDNGECGEKADTSQRTLCAVPAYFRVESDGVDRISFVDI